ncbi:MAG: sugar phosphate nucleotidyltransferase, partial [Smithella sp.]
MKPNTIIIPTILCGGAGTRLWPLSRDQYPKQFLNLAGSETMLQSTIRRMNDFSGNYKINDEPIIVCNEDHRFLVAEQVRQVTER